VRIFLAGATGVLGRSLIPHLTGHDVVGLTRSHDKARLLQELGVVPVVADAYDRERLVEVVVEARPDVVVNFLTDLTAGSSELNARIRREIGPAVVDAAEAASAGRLVVESVAWPLEGASGEALSLLERSALESKLEALVIRFGRLWGPGTRHAEPPEPPRVRIDAAGWRAAELIAARATGIEVVA
jgi:putative NADH-flavin reductase